MDRLDELVGYTLFVALLHGLHHISALLTCAVHNQVVAFLHTLPALIAIHRIETSYDAGNSGIVGSTNLSNLLDEANTRVRISVTSIHIAMHKHLILQTIGLTNLDEFEQVVET